jgi:hypothetical protein
LLKLDRAELDQVRSEQLSGLERMFGFHTLMCKSVCSARMENMLPPTLPAKFKHILGLIPSFLKSTITLEMKILYNNASTSWYTSRAPLNMLVLRHTFPLNENGSEDLRHRSMVRYGTRYGMVRYGMLMNLKKGRIS